MAAEVTLELQSFTGAPFDAPGSSYEFRPNLVVHTRDLRNMVAVKDWNRLEARGPARLPPKFRRRVETGTDARRSSRPATRGVPPRRP